MLEEQPLPLRGRYLLVARIERSEMRGAVFPDVASLHPGYGFARVARQHRAHGLNQLVLGHRELRRTALAPFLVRRDVGGRA